MTALPPIAEVLPHAAPMILLDEVLSSEPERTRCALTLRPGSPFVRDGRVAAVVAIEYMAQAVAAHSGLKARAEGRAPSLGFLLGTRELRLEVEHLRVGDRVEVEVERVFGDAQLGSFRCRAWRGGEALAEAVLNVYQSEGGEPP